MLSRIAILLLKVYFGREKINFHEWNLKHRKIILLINFVFAQTCFLTTSYQVLKNYAILINYKSLFQRKKIPYNLTISNFRKWTNCYQIQQFVYKNFVLENVLLIVSANKEFIFKNQERWRCGKSSLWKNHSWFIRIA